MCLCVCVDGRYNWAFTANNRENCESINESKQSGCVIMSAGLVCFVWNNRMMMKKKMIKDVVIFGKGGKLKTF